ncbi:MAG: hypothetical protein ABSF03_24825 [Streptosporangiaceae bacterium]
MTAPGTRPDGRPETAFVLLIDFRAAASGPDAVGPASVDEQTLEERQRSASAARTSAGTQGGTSISGWRILNFGRLLVVDDAADFAEHAEAYRCLLQAPTFGRMLCVVVGAPAEPPYLDVPKSVDTARVPVLWVGDPCGVGWRVGWSTTTRLAFSDADPDGTKTVANLIESLTAIEMFDQTAGAIDGLPERTGTVAVLPWVGWPHADEHEPQPGDEQDDAQAEPHDDLAPDDPRPGGTRMRRWAIAVLLSLTCAVVTLTVVLAVEVSRLSVGYVAADIVGGVLMLALLANASRMPPINHARPVLVPAVPGPPTQPEQLTARASGSPTPVSRYVLDHAAWMMGATAADESFRQLTSPEQLVMLGAESVLVRLVRFAPASARRLLDPAADRDYVAWTTSGDQVGVIRLAPLKAGLVRPRGA